MSLFNFFNAYPYTEFQKINLDWIMKKLKELESQYNTVIEAAAAATTAAREAEAAAAEATQTIGDAENAIAEATAATLSATQAAETATQAAQTATAEAQTAQQTAGSALSTAQSANSTAAAANTTAQSASTTATEASTTAQAASAAANEAVQTANGVASTANNALAEATAAVNKQSWGPHTLVNLTSRTVSGGVGPWCTITTQGLYCRENLAHDALFMDGYFTIQVSNDATDAPNGVQVIDTDFPVSFTPDDTTRFSMGSPYFITDTAPTRNAAAAPTIRSGGTSANGTIAIDSNGNLSVTVYVTGAIRGKYLTLIVPRVTFPYPAQSE